MRKLLKSEILLHFFKGGYESKKYFPDFDLVVVDLSRYADNEIRESCCPES